MYYLPGNKQIMADFLSRYHAPQIMSVDEPIMNQTPYLEHIIHKQMNDPEISLIKKQIESDSPITSEHFANLKDNMYIAKGAVMARIDKNDLVLIPFKDREEFVLNTHLDTLIPHIGGDKLVQKILEVAFVANLHAILNKIISMCGRCVQNKRLSLVVQNSPLQPMPVSNSIGERWHIDSWGPFIDNNQKYYIVGAVEILTKCFVAKVV